MNRQGHWILKNGKIKSCEEQKNPMSAEEEIEAIQEIDGVEAATRYLAVNVGLKDTKKSVSLNVSENYTVSTMLVMEGEDYDENSEGIWLSDKFADANEKVQIGTLESAYFQELLPISILS